MAVLKVAGETEVIIGSGLPQPLLPEREGRSRAAILTQPAPTDIALEVAQQLFGARCPQQSTGSGLITSLALSSSGGVDL